MENKPSEIDKCNRQNPLTIGQQLGNHNDLKKKLHNISKVSFKCERCNSTFTTLRSIQRHERSSKHHQTLLALGSKLPSLNYQPSISNLIGTPVKSIERTKSPTFTSHQAIPCSQELETHTLSHQVLPINFGRPIEDTEVFAEGPLGIVSLFPQDDNEVFMYQHNQNIQWSPNLQLELQAHNDLNFSIPQGHAFYASSHPLYFDPIGLDTYISTVEDSISQDASRSEFTEAFKHNIKACTDNAKAKITFNASTDGKHLECDIADCQETFKTKRLIRTHQKDCHGIEKSYKCPYSGCEKAYRYNGDFKEHYKKKHAEVLELSIPFLNADNPNTF